MAHAGRSVVLHGEIAEQSQAVSRQQKTRYSRCRQSTHTVKQCAVINCVVLCCLGFHSPLSMQAKLSSYQALPDIIVNIRALAAHYSFNTKTQMNNSCVVKIKKVNYMATILLLLFTPPNELPRETTPTMSTQHKGVI